MKSLQTRHTMRACNGRRQSMRWPIACPVILPVATYSDGIHPHRIRGMRVKCISGKWTRRGALMRTRLGLA